MTNEPILKDDTIKILDIEPTFQCNNNCKFCSISVSERHRKRSTEGIKEMIKEAKDRGIEIIGFTGGEPTIRKDIFELVRYAKSLGFRTVRIQTNGRMFSYKEFTKKMVDAGANYFKFTILSHTSEIHDELTRSPGSFEQSIQGIKNVKSFNRPIEVNILINKINYKFLPQIVNFLLGLGVHKFSFGYINYIGNAWIYKDELAVSYTDVIPYLKEAIEIVKDFDLDKVIVIYIPYCFMQGYEICIKPDVNPFNTEIGGPDFVVSLDDNVKKEKIKLPQCRECMYENICNGVREDYIKIFGTNEIAPVKEQEIKVGV